MSSEDLIGVSPKMLRCSRDSQFLDSAPLSRARRNDEGIEIASTMPGAAQSLRGNYG